MGYCKHCGGKVVENARFCISCCCPIDEEDGIVEKIEDSKNHANKLHIDLTQSVDEFDEYKEILGVEKPKNVDKPKKRFRNFFKFKSK